MDDNHRRYTVVDEVDQDAGRCFGSERIVPLDKREGNTMADQWTVDAFREPRVQTIPVLLGGKLVEATIRKYEDQDETTIQVGDDYYGTTWSDILEALNAGRPLEITPNPDHFQQRS